MDQVLLEGIPEDLVGELELLDSLVLQILDRDLHDSLSTLAALGAPDGDVAVVGAGNGAAQINQVLLAVDLHHQQVLDRDALAAHAAGAAQAGVHARGERRVADRARRAVEHRAVARAAAAEVMPLDDALKALALARTDDVDVVLLGEDR